MIEVEVKTTWQVTGLDANDIMGERVMLNDTAGWMHGGGYSFWFGPGEPWPPRVPERLKAAANEEWKKVTSREAMPILIEDEES